MKLLIDTLSIDLPDLTPSQEGVSEDGVEREYVFYGQMTNRADLEKAISYEDQEQYRVFIPSKEKNREITARIRKTLMWAKGGADSDQLSGPIYHLTIKSFLKGEKGCSEAETEIPAEQGQKLLEVFRMAGDGMVKRRYVFPCGPGYFPDQDVASPVRVRKELPEDMVWEVDVPLPPDPTTAGPVWVKLDLEVKTWDLKINDKGFPLPFPIRLTEVIYQQPGTRDKETEDRVKAAMVAFKPTLPTASTEAFVYLDTSDPQASLKITLGVAAAVWVIGKAISAIRRMSKQRRERKFREENAQEFQRLQSAQREEDKILLTVKRTFLNGEWLDKHRMEMRSVSGKNVIGALSQGGRFPGSAHGVMDAVRGEIQEVKRVIAYLKSKGKARDENVYDDFDLHPEKLLGDVEWVAESRKLSITYSQRGDSITPLSKIDVPNVADLVIECVKLCVELEELAMSAKRVHKLPVEWALADSLLATARALTWWMGRSVKQRDVSTEALIDPIEVAVVADPLQSFLKSLVSEETNR